VLESQTVQTVAEEQVMHPAAQGVQAPRVSEPAVVTGAVVKFPEAGHSQAWVVPTWLNPEAQTHPAVREVHLAHPAAHGAYLKVAAVKKYPVSAESAGVSAAT